MFSIEYIKRWYELIVKTIHDCVSAIDRARLRQFHFLERVSRNVRHVEFVFRARLMHGNERHASLCKRIAPRAELLRSFMTEVATLRPKRDDDGKTAKFFRSHLAVYPSRSPLKRREGATHSQRHLDLQQRLAGFPFRRAETARLQGLKHAKRFLDAAADVIVGHDGIF